MCSLHFNPTQAEVFSRGSMRSVPRAGFVPSGEEARHSAEVRALLDAPREIASLVMKRVSTIFL